MQSASPWNLPGSSQIRRASSRRPLVPKPENAQKSLKLDAASIYSKGSGAAKPRRIMTSILAISTAGRADCLRRHLCHQPEARGAGKSNVMLHRPFPIRLFRRMVAAMYSRTCASKRRRPCADGQDRLPAGPRRLRRFVGRTTSRSSWAMPSGSSAAIDSKRRAGDVMRLR